MRQNEAVQFKLASGGVEQLSLGVGRDEAGVVLARWGELQPFRRAPSVNPDSSPGWVVTRPGSDLFVYCDTDGLVDAIEFVRPRPTTIDADQVTFDGIDLFANSADHVLDEIRRNGHVVDTSEGGYSNKVADVLIALWRDGEPVDEPSGLPRYFESVLVARPNYYDRQR